MSFTALRNGLCKGVSQRILFPARHFPTLKMTRDLIQTPLPLAVGAQIVLRLVKVSAVQNAAETPPHGKGARL